MHFLKVIFACVSSFGFLAASEFSLGKEDACPSFRTRFISGSLQFFAAPPRPGGGKTEWEITAQLKESGARRKISLPARLYLTEGKDEKLLFSSEPSLFWIEAVEGKRKRSIETTVWVKRSLEEAAEQVEVFSSPLERAKWEELAHSLPIQKLRQLHWVGSDRLLRSLAKEAPQERFIDPSLPEGGLCLSPRDWLVFNGERWEKKEDLPPGEIAPIAHIEEVREVLYFGVWEGENYFQLAFAPLPLPPARLQPAELFSNLRIRSDQQVSCMLEKQWLVLRTGDWVCKREGKWKVLRKKEDREALQRGEIQGELFLFEQIETRQGQKVMRGTLFDVSRTHAVHVEISAASPGKRGAAGKGRAA